MDFDFVQCGFKPHSAYYESTKLITGIIRPGPAEFSRLKEGVEDG